MHSSKTASNHGFKQDGFFRKSIFQYKQKDAEVYGAVALSKLDSENSHTSCVWGADVRGCSTASKIFL